MPKEIQRFISTQTNFIDWIIACAMLLKDEQIRILFEAVVNEKYVKYMNIKQFSIQRL